MPKSAKLGTTFSLNAMWEISRRKATIIGRRRYTLEQPCRCQKMKLENWIVRLLQIKLYYLEEIQRPISEVIDRISLLLDNMYCRRETALTEGMVPSIWMNLRLTALPLLRAPVRHSAKLAIPAIDEINSTIQMGDLQARTCFCYQNSSGKVADGNRDYL